MQRKQRLNPEEGIQILGSSHASSSRYDESWKPLFAFFLVAPEGFCHLRAKGFLMLKMGQEGISTRGIGESD